jgi:hypothetical protein
VTGEASQGSGLQERPYKVLGDKKDLIRFWVIGKPHKILGDRKGLIRFWVKGNTS